MTYIVPKKLAVNVVLNVTSFVTGVPRPKLLFITKVLFNIRLADLYTTPSYKHVTVTWYRLSRSKVYSSHTLTTLLTPLNQERRSSATYS